VANPKDDFKKVVEDLMSGGKYGAKAPAPEEVRGVFEDMEKAETEGGEYQKLFSELTGEKPPSKQDFYVDTFFHLHDDKPGWLRDVPSMARYKHYVPNLDMLEMAFRAWQKNHRVMLVGDPGCGKSTGIEYMCALTGKPFYRFNFHRDTERQDIFGEVHIDAKDGVSITEYWLADLPKTVSNPYSILLDEFTNAPSGIVETLKRLLERGGDMYLPDKKDDNVIKPHADFRICTASNAKGLGDQMDKYTASNVMDIATLDRLDVTIEMDYLPAKREQALVTLWQPDLPKEMVSDLVKFCNLTREGFRKGEISLPMSPRGLEAVAMYTMDFLNPIKAIKYCYFNKLADDGEKAAVIQLAQTVFREFNKWGGLK
jgi:cobaltochelatase CobS|tara:strand:+ start:2778 stop:3890 length:1113 start_codon:yes stop_codon:yes gene_type:complete